jgi:hypothetical protein
MKIDLTKLEGYRDDMSAEEKLALLDKYDLTTDGWVKKDTFDKTASELAEVKRKLKEKQTEEERKEAERLEAEAKLKAELEELRKETAITKHKARFLSLGYEDKLAEETARAMADGDFEKVFTNQAKHLENVKKAAAASAIANEQVPPPGSNGGGMTKEQFDKLTSAEQIDFMQKNPDWKQIIGIAKE